MKNKKDFYMQNKATKRLLINSQEKKFPFFIEYSGLTIRVDEGVFSPKHFDGWRVFNKNFPVFDGKKILEIGTGTGVTALFLASEGARKVVAVDINEKAIENLKKNVLLNNISNIDARHSDIFSKIKANEKFDIIYWNMPFGYVDHDYEHENDLERSIFDPGYKILARFLKESPKHLNDQGFVLIGTGSGANIEKFKEIVAKSNLNLQLLAKEDAQEIFPVDFQLYKLTKT